MRQKGKIFIRDKDKADKIFKRMDQVNIDKIKERIDLANKWADEIYDIVNTGKKLSSSKWKDHKLKALEYKNHLEAIADPRNRIFLHLEENQNLSRILSKRLEESLNYAIKRLDTNIEVIKGKIDKREIELSQIDFVSKKEDQYLRRPIAFCICLLYLDEKYDISTMTKKGLTQFIEDNFKDQKTGKAKSSVQKVVRTLMGHDARFVNEKPMFYFIGKKWEFREDHFDYMKKKYSDDYNKATEMIKEFK